jgi:hypothetical protein
MRRPSKERERERESSFFFFFFFFKVLLAFGEKKKSTLNYENVLHHFFCALSLSLSLSLSLVKHQNISGGEFFAHTTRTRARARSKQ